jgi:8-amino-7-oxononanoate synthase
MARAGGALVGVFRHLDLEDLESQLQTWRAAASPGALALVASDAVFSMDGDAADLPALLSLCERHGALLLVDEAHATGLLGSDGAGLAQLQGVHGRVPLVMGTLGKAIGSFGAFVCCDPLLRDHLLNTARGFIFSTALPPPVLAAALEGIRLARTEPWRRERALALAERVRAALGQPPQPSAIVPVPVGPDTEAVRLAQWLQGRGFDVRAVRPPTVPEGSARLRITTGARLADGPITALILALKEALGS